VGMRSDTKGIRDARTGFDILAGRELSSVSADVIDQHHLWHPSSSILLPQGEKEEVERGGP
jgi:hypothetical protein